MNESYRLEEVDSVAAKICPTFSDRQVILLSGPMGAGKTTWVRAVVSYFGGDGVMSPTYALHNRYESKVLSIDHIDLFRLESVDELQHTGFWDLFAQKSGLIIIEWPEKLGDYVIPSRWKVLSLNIEYSTIEDQRVLTT